jgi:fructosamine-3-kinase
MSIDAIIRATFAGKVDRIQHLSGGDINQAARVEKDGQVYFVKYKRHAPPHFFERESRGLDLLREASAGTFRIPTPISCAEETSDCPAYLVLEWIERSQPSRTFAQDFGRALAQLHRVSDSAFGLDHDNYIGELPQHNDRTANWIDFYRDQRIRPQMELARTNGYLPTLREKLLTQLMERLEDLLANVPSLPSLLHGDLWSGNYIAGEKPAIYDPAVYYGDREIELAFTELFGGFPSDFYSAYREAYPLHPGYEHRRALYQLYPMLTHLNLFGEGYGGQVDAICRQYY